MRMLLNYLNSRSQLRELLEELLCCLPITPKTCQNISLFPFVSCVLSLSDRTLRLAFLYDIVSLFPGEVGGGERPISNYRSIQSAAQHAEKRQTQWRSFRTLLTRDSGDNETMRWKTGHKKAPAPVSYTLINGPKEKYW